VTKSAAARVGIRVALWIGVRVRDSSGRALRYPVEERQAPDALVGRSARMRAVFDFVRVISGSQSNVLIIGETGTGKETLAKLIHRSSPRRRGPFVAIGCAILTETSIEAELFGHERGSLTGAGKDRPSRFEMADGGTIFLDDIDDVPLWVQVKLLRVVQQRVVERVGASRPRPIDVRVVAGSRRSLRRLVADGQFRPDLYYRLNVLPIGLPPLRERREDIPLLTDLFMRRSFKGRRARVPELSPAVRDAFMRYGWPGNVRELENACERLARTCTCGRIRVACLPPGMLVHAPPEPPPPCSDERHMRLSLDERLRQVEADWIAWALDASHANKSKAAELLRMKRSTLGDRIRSLGLTRT
jgi:DNA-binding NtrC family response regulator